MNNFEFLKKEEVYNSFSNACIEAEKSVVVSYGTTAILSRRALELAVKWVFSYDQDLNAPYQDNLATLLTDYDFNDIIEPSLKPLLRYIQKLGNKVVHTTTPVKREEAILCLRNLYEFIKWIDYSYSEEYEDKDFDESIIQDNDNVQKKQDELKSLYEKLSSKDKKLEEIIQENEELRLQYTQLRKENTETRTYEVSDLSEYHTRKKYIDLEIELNGFTIGTDCLEEVKVTGMPNSSGDGYVDYVLYNDSGKPLAVVEAKRTSKDPKIGKVQAKLYADRLQVQTGVRPIIFYTNGFEYYIWDDLNYPERKISGLYAKKDLEKLMFRRQNRKDLNNLDIKEEITNRYYQKEAIQAVCEAYQAKRRKTLLVMATGSGKTRTAISLVDVLSRKGWVTNVLFLADRVELVKQAKSNFKRHLEHVSRCNLSDSKDNPESRMVFSTYPTMMNAIDDIEKGNSKIFTKGHFDLIILDESHRSIYKKYGAIFEYFDANLLGLTATPKSDIDKNTYEIFELESGVPTYAYDLQTAVEDKFLVDYHTIETKMKFMTEGIHYDDLSDEDKEAFEETFDDNVKDISSEELNSFLFNDNTIDTVLNDLMTRGIKVEGEEKLGKTIIFAKNQKHADFILKRFNEKYSKHNGKYAETIHNKVNYVSSSIADFSTKEKLPQIAISVDMLDTGIDIPEIVNLVFFKKVRSKSKFWQMIGRGTRLCPDLFGVGLDKKGFRIFDYCQNFEYFRTDPKGKEAKLIKSLTENLFNIKVKIIQALERTDYQVDELIKYRKNLVKSVVADICEIDETKFNARMKLEFIHRYNNSESFTSLSDIKVKELEDEIAPLLKSIDDDEMAKRFDYLMYSIELAYLNGRLASRNKTKVVSTGAKLENKGTVKKVLDQVHIIKAIQTNDFWDNADVFDYEEVRKALRDLIKYLDGTQKRIYYTNFEDEILEVVENEAEYDVNSYQTYKKKVKHYLNEHINDEIILKLRFLEEITSEELKHLEYVLWNELGSENDYKQEFGLTPLRTMILNIVGVDKEAANKLFSKFLSDENLNANQRDFVKMIVDYVVSKGIIEREELNEYPFNKYGNLAQLFDGKIEIAKEIISVINRVS